MSLLYHPMSRTVSLRDVSGCLTPNNQTEDASGGSKGALSLKVSSVPVKSNDSILSPPLSPYQRSAALHEVHGHTSFPSPYVASNKNYLATSSPFKVENYKSYELTINPWINLNANYKKRHLRFLEQYQINSAREVHSSYSATKMAERRAAASTRKRVLTSDSDEDSNVERIRTRRVAKESPNAVSEDSAAPVSRASSPSPKKKKARKETPYASSPLAIQQAALIDENIPDYSPSVDLLQNNKCLKIEWKGQPMNLSEDPNLSKLHPAETLLASILRLPCNVYLDSKRRFFFEKVSRMRKGLQFRRTDAQKACRIDVNKASRLFAAYEKVGWLDESLFAKYL